MHYGGCNYGNSFPAEKCTCSDYYEEQRIERLFIFLFQKGLTIEEISAITNKNIKYVRSIINDNSSDSH